MVQNQFDTGNITHQSLWKQVRQLHCQLESLGSSLVHERGLLESVSVVLLGLNANVLFTDVKHLLNSSFNV